MSLEPQQTDIEPEPEKPDNDPTEYHEVYFEATIKLSDDELADAEDDVAQAVQNCVGHTGTCVIMADY